MHGPTVLETSQGSPTPFAYRIELQSGTGEFMFIIGAKSFLPHYREAQTMLATKVSQGRRANRAPFGRQGLILWVAVSPCMSASPLPFNMPRNRLPKKALYGSFPK